MKSESVRARAVILALVMVILVALAVYSAFAIPDSISSVYNTSFNNEIKLKNNSFFVGDNVLIFFENPERVKEVRINSSKNSYFFVGNVKNPLDFRPSEEGKYTINAEYDDGKKAEISFNVIKKEDNKTGSNQKSERLISIEKKEYCIGEDVIIKLNLPENESYGFSIDSKNNIYNFISVDNNEINFIPTEQGRHYARLEKNNKIVESKFFDVLVFRGEDKNESKKEGIWIEKKEYTTGEKAEIYLTGGIENINITAGKETFRFENIRENISLVLEKGGIYNIFASSNNESFKDNFIVKNPEKDTNESSNNMTLYFDLSEEVNKRKTILDRIFNTAMVEQVTAYIENNANNNNFKIDIEKSGEYSFKTSVSGNQNIKNGKYNLVFEALIKGEKVRKEKIFEWVSNDEEEIIQENQEKENKKEVNESRIKEYVPYYFDIKDNPMIEVDFTERINSERSIIESALKKASAERISAYVEGEEENSNFIVNIEHIEFDKFRLSIQANGKIKRDVYKIIAVVKKGDEFFSEQNLFSWGVSNVSVLKQKISEKDRDIGLDEIITVTGINKTETKKDEIQINEKVLEEEKQANITSSQENKIIDSEINESNKLIKLSNKLISEKLSIKNLDNKDIESEINVLDEKNKSVIETKERKIFGIFSVKTKAEVDVKEYDLEILLKNQSVKKILMKDLMLKEDENPELKIEKLKKENINDSLKNPKNSFSIDPSKLNFTNAELTLNAKGSELYKCKDWNFTEQKCYGEWKKVKDIVPGRDYKIDINSEDPAFTEIGLATINTHKSVYLPNEEAFIGIGILDHKGRVVCNASVVLEITDPNGKKTTLTTENNDIKISDECHLYEVTELPDYYTIYRVGSPGNYIVNITAATYDGNPVMVDIFSVESHVDFDVERKGPTRIFPPVKYEMNFTIKANKDYNGLIKEIVPKEFEITSQDDLTVSETQENKILTWNKNLEKGNTYSISYEFDAPDVWPDIFYLGPLSIGIWKESRQWQIASDAQAGTIQDLGSFSISAADINIGATTTATADMSTVNKNGNVDEETWEIFIETDGDTRITTSCQIGTPIKVISATGSGASYSTYCTDNSPNNATITCTNVPKATNLGTFTFVIESCEAGSDTYRLESTSITGGADDFTGSDTLTVNAADSTPPTISLNNPYDNTWETSRNVNFTYTTTTNDHFENCSLWTNESGWSLKQINKSEIINNSLNWINETLDSDGYFLWNIECYDQNGNSDMDSENYTVNVDTSNPTVTLESPDPDYYDDTSDPITVIFNCSITDNLEPKNISLYLTNGNNESFSFNDSCTISGNGYCEWSKSLPNGNYAWSCLGYDESGRYDWGNNQTAKINSTFSVPQIHTIQCQEQNGGWVDCSNIDFHEKLLAVRVNFTNGNAYITNASFNLTNIPDDYTYFYSNSSYNTSGYWVYNNTDIVINDSGGFKLEINSWDSSNSTDSSSAEWSIPWGTLSANLVNPTADTPVNQNSFFTFTAEVSCSGGECGNVNATLDPNEGPNAPSSCTGNWIQCGGSYSNGGTESTADSDNLNMDFYNFSFSVPATTIKGIEVIHDSYETDGTGKLNISLSWDGGTSWTDERTTQLTNTETTYSEGNAIDTWGRKWNSSEINSDNFRVRFESDGSGDEWRVDYVRIRVFYAVPATAYYDPISDSQTGWSCSGASCGTGHYAVLDEGTRQPDSPITTDYVYEASNVDSLDEHSVGTISGTNISYVRLWAYVSTGSNCELGINLQNDGSNVALGLIPTSTALSWVNLTWAEPVNAGTVTAEFNTTRNGGGSPENCNVYSWYIEVLSENASQKSGAISTIIGDEPFYTTDSNPQDYNDQSCLYGLVDGDSCQVTWNVNATGWLNTSHEFFVQFNMTSNKNYVSDAETSHIEINITQTASLPPIVTLEFPEDNNLTSDSNALFSCSATDGGGGGLDNITLYANFNGTFSPNETKSITGSSDSETFTKILADGVYEWNCLAYDTDGNDDWGNSNRTITVDTTEPYIDLNEPEINATFFSDTINFNFTVTDNIDNQMICNITINSTVRDENFNADNGSLTPRTITGLSQGYYLWNVTCADDAGNTNTSLTRNFTIIDLPPEVFLLTPNSSFNHTNIGLQYNATDNNNVTIARLFVNGAFNHSNTSVITDAVNSFNLENLGEGFYTWTVNISDISNLSDKADENSFTIDITDPVVELLDPPGPFTTDSSTIQFDYNVTDNLDEYLTCSITINGSVEDLNYNAQNDSNTSRALSNINDGVSYWNATCYDDAGNFNVSETRMINVSEPPSVNLNSPETGHAQNESSITLYYTPLDNSDLSRCDLLINGNFNQTNSTQVSNGAQNSFTLTNLGSGNYTWTINCTDKIGLGDTAFPSRDFVIDTEKPTIILYNPEPNESIYSENVTFNYTVIDNFDEFMLCNLTLDGTVRITNAISENSSFIERTITAGYDGVHYWNATCYDDAGNFNVSETRNFTTYSPPSIELKNPEPNTFSNETSMTFRYIPYDGDGLDGSELIINGTFNQTNSSNLVNNGSNYFYLTFETNGVYTWTVNATDKNGLEGTAPERTLTIDNSSPSVILNSPREDDIIDWNNVSFNFTVDDNLDSQLLCNMTLSDSVEFENIDVSSPGTEIRNKSLYDGNYNWSVTCYDDSGNMNISETINFSVYAPPNVTLNYPVEEQRVKGFDIDLNYTPRDALGFDNCTLFFMDSENETDSYIEANVPNIFQIHELKDGNYNWTARCIDYLPDANEYTASSENFTIDNEGPVITLNEPGPEEELNYNDVYFNWTADDNEGVALICNLSVSNASGQINENGITKVSGSYFNITVDDLEYGVHYWNVSCSDDLGNANISELRNFTINRPDLQVNTTYLVFNNTSPEEGKNITINATVFNIGGVSATNFIVRFFNESPLNGGTQIGDDITISSLDYGENITIGVNWTTQLGMHEIWVIVDQDNTVSELSETNNNASRNITISTWHIIYGRSLGNLVISDLENLSIFNWYTENASSGNIFAVDYDSGIRWNNLTSIGRDIYGNLQMDDFEEIDTALGTTDYSDSINRSYTSNSLPIKTRNFTVYYNVIENVSVINSTNSSNFVTGILWDSSDEGDEYDTSQDIIFVSEINKDKQGAYGVYNYEMRVPSELKKYIVGDQYSVALYAEIK